MKRASGSGRIQRHQGLDRLMQLGPAIAAIELNPIRKKRSMMTSVVGDGFVMVRHHDLVGAAAHRGSGQHRAAVDRRMTTPRGKSAPADGAGAAATPAEREARLKRALLDSWPAPLSPARRSTCSASTRSPRRASRAVSCGCSCPTPRTRGARSGGHPPRRRPRRKTRIHADGLFDAPAGRGLLPLHLLTLTDEAGHA